MKNQTSDSNVDNTQVREFCLDHVDINLAYWARQAAEKQHDAVIHPEVRRSDSELAKSMVMSESKIQTWESIKQAFNYQIIGT
jgi:hypothetical protein